MLLRNESRVRNFIDIKLVFDDNRTRELEIHELDKIQISYRKNGCIKCGVGVVRDIKPYAYTKKFPFCRKESAVITVDMSEDHVCCVDKIDMFDIIDVRKVVIDDSDKETSSDKDFDIRGEGCRVGCQITADGVIIHE